MNKHEMDPTKAWSLQLRRTILQRVYEIASFKREKSDHKEYAKHNMHTRRQVKGESLWAFLKTGKGRGTRRLF